MKKAAVEVSLKDTPENTALSVFEGIIAPLIKSKVAASGQEQGTELFHDLFYVLARFYLATNGAESAQDLHQVIANATDDLPADDGAQPSEEPQMTDEVQSDEDFHEPEQNKAN